MNIGLKPVTEQLSDEYNVIKKKKRYGGFKIRSALSKTIHVLDLLCLQLDWVSVHFRLQ